MTTPPKTRVLIVDDHPLVRAGLAMRLAMTPHFDVCGEADSEEEAFALVKQTNPDLVIVDISLKRGHGIELIKRIKSKFAAVRMLVVSGHAESIYAERALRAGAHGYLSKQQSNELLVEAIAAVRDGRRYLSDEMASRLLDKVFDAGDSTESPIECLSDRELQVFDLISVGLTSRAIANRLHLSPHTIDTHRENIKRKLGLSSSAELTRMAVRWRIECE